MDGLPKNKKPVRQPGQRDNVALDNYLFERKLQEVYDKKAPSDDLPKPVKAIKKLFKKKPKSPSVTSQIQTQKQKKRRKKTQLIDAPYIAPKRPVATVTAAKKPKKLIIVPRVALKRPAINHIVMFGALALVVAVGLSMPNKRQSTDVLGEATEVKTVSQKPDFAVLTPTTNQAAIQSKIKFDASKKVASYTDTLDGGNVVISQQKLGETEIKDKEFLRRTSLNFNLNKEVTTKKGQAYIGENKDKNTQFATFIYNDFLIFMQIDRVLKYQSIVEYIDSLQ